MLSNFHVQTKQKTSYLAIAILLVSVLFASCVLPSLKLGSASIEMDITIPQYMEKTEKIDSSARFIHPDAEKLVVSIEASDMDTATYEFSITTKVNKISIKDLAPGKNRTITVKLYNKNANNGDQVLAENNKIVNLKHGLNSFVITLIPKIAEKLNLNTFLNYTLSDIDEGTTYVYSFNVQKHGIYHCYLDVASAEITPNIGVIDPKGKVIKAKKGEDKLEFVSTMDGEYFVAFTGDSTNISGSSLVLQRLGYALSKKSLNIGALTYVPAGSFQRDGTATNISVITEPYYMSQYQITREQFEEIMGEDPSNEDSSSGMSDPVQMVSWYHAIAFCNKLSLLEGLTPVYKVEGVDDWKNLAFDDIPTSSNTDWDAATCNWDANGYRLPTEMEWMWAAMGAPTDGQGGGINTTGRSKAFAGSTGTNSIDDYAWHNGNSEETHPVGKKLPNELGLYDMSGNVNEWCWDWKADYPTGEESDYRGAGSGSSRVSRGGCYYYNDYLCTVAERYDNDPYNQNDGRGFRVLRPVQSP
jgi:sulfatase modifying factor 1